MRDQSRSYAGIFIAGAILLAAAIFTGAQTNIAPSRITQAIDPAQLTILRGNTNPLALPQFDRGAAPASLPMQRMLLVLKRGPQQESALDSLLEAQQNAASSNYHQWLTPQQFGQQFGPSDRDIQTITSWLQSQGFQVDRVSNGRTAIEFSGTAGEVQSAFHTSIHQYLVNGQNHWANSSDPSIPAALAPVVAGIDSLYNFPRRPLYHLAANPRAPITIAGNLAGPSQFTFTNGCSVTAQPFCNFALGPFDFATIYNVLPLWNGSTSAGAIDGTGQTIAIVGESDINKTDVENFQTFFGLAVKDPTIILNGPDPGTVPGDETESDLDVEWAGAVAKGANIDLVVSETTEASLGVDLSAQYVVDNNLAPVLSESYGVCELFLGSAGNQFYDRLWQQAAAQGITVIVSAGDAGSATCDGNLGSQGPAQYGLSVNGIASTPYNIAMGGTDFNDISNQTAYWNLTNSTSPNASGGVASVSAKGYIPEMTWNDTCTNQELFSEFGVTSAAQFCNDQSVTGQYPFLLDPAGGGGGESGCTASDGQTLSSCSQPYSKPAWQTALTPNDSTRDIPDIAMFASNGFNSTFYVVCEADMLNTQNETAVGGGIATTSCSPTDPDTGIVGLGGTSAPTPAFAGIMAMVNQATGARQGDANYILYKLAGQTGNTCTSAPNPAGTCVFYDVPSGSTIAMPCVSGSPNCTTATGNQHGVLSGYATGTGYDLATGLGSVNAANLVNKWKSFALTLEGSATALTLTPPSGGSLTNLTHGQAVTFTTNVSAVAPATGTPTGTVALLAQNGGNGQGFQSVTLDSTGAASGSTTSLPGGTYTVVGNYPGDGTFKSSISPGTTVTVNPEASKVQIAYETLNPGTGAIANPNATTAVFGTPSLLRVNVTSAAGDACATNGPGSTGCPTGSIALTDTYNGGAAAPLDGGSFGLNSQGYAEDQIIDLAGGTHVIGVNYGGDASYSAPTPNPTTQTLTITPAPTQISLDGSLQSVLVGSEVSLFANLTAVNIFSSHPPSGSVNFMMGSTQVGSAPLTGTLVPTTHRAAGGANLSTTSLPHGQDSIVAQYSGDGSYAPSTSAPFVVSVLYPDNIAVTTSNPSIQYGQSVTLTAQLTSSQSGGPAITGTVLFSVNFGTELGSATLVNGTAQITTSAIPGGVQNIVATYSGDSNYSGGSGTVSQAVARNSTTTAVTTSSTTITQGQSVTLTATITPSASGPSLPVGNVEFTVNGNNFSGAFVSGGTQAQITTTTLPVGSDRITAIYGGDTNYTGSTSSATTVTVNAAPSFSIAANPIAIAIGAPGQSGTTALTFTSQGGLTGSAMLSAASCSGLPSESSCSFNPSTITLAANGTASSTLTVATTAASGVVPVGSGHWNFGDWVGLSAETTAALALMLLLCIGIALASRGRSRRWSLAFAAVALAFVFIGVGCGGGGGGGNGGGSGGGGGGNNGGGGPSNPGTPVGSSTMTVSVTINGVTQTVPLTVSVQ